MTNIINYQVNCFTKEKKENSIPICIFTKNEFNHWLEKQSLFTKNFCNSQIANDLNIINLPNNDGNLSKVIIIENEINMYSLAELPKKLESNNYHLKTNLNDKNLEEKLYLGFAFGDYIFDRYKKNIKKDIKLFLPKDYENVISTAESVYIARSMISTPAEDMGPAEISQIIKDIAIKFNAEFNEIVGEELLKQNYNGVYAVGKGSHREPRVVNLLWGDNKNPKISLVGKGVVFDTGGLDIKMRSGMEIMHKDMGGSANAIALAYLIMKNNLPIKLSLSIPTVENATDAKSYRPSDIITMKNGKTVQVTNTDAEGRIILADVLFEESSKKPNLLIDFATLTGAARVAVGPEISAYFTNDKKTSNLLEDSAEKTNDPVWRLPLHKGYKKYLKSEFADILNCGYTPYAGATTAGLFLQNFVEKDCKWLHFDIMAWNVSNTAGKPIGGEAMGIRAVYDMLQKEYC